MKSRKIFNLLFACFGIALMLFSFTTAFAAPYEAAGGIAQLVSDPSLFINNFHFSLTDPYGAVGGVSLGMINMVSLGQPDDLTFEDGTENMGGFGSVAYIALRSHIAGYPTESTDHSDISNLAKLVGDFTFNAGKNFITADCIPQSVGLTSEGQGEHVGSQSFAIKGKFMISGTGAQAKGYARLLNNQYGVIVLINDNGERIVCGTYQRPARFKVSVPEGEKPSDTKALQVEFTADSFVPGYIYEGVITLNGGSLPAVS